MFLLSTVHFILYGVNLFKINTHMCYLNKATETSSYNQCSLFGLIYNAKPRVSCYVLCADHQMPAYLYGMTLTLVQEHLMFT